MAYIVAGLVLGGIYAIAAAGLVITYNCVGVINFAFGSEAFFFARLYYFLHTQHNWAIAPAAIVSTVIAGPIVGAVLYSFIFRYLTLSTTLTKIVATIGLAVSIPALTTLVLGNPSISSAPGLAPLPVSTVRILGVSVTLDQIIVLACLVLVVVFGIIAIRFTSIGLATRAMVDSPALTSVSGTSPKRVSLIVWIVVTTLVALTGVLVAPIIGLTSTNNFTVVMASAFAAVVAAKLTRIGLGVSVGILLGVLGGIAEWFIPSNSVWSSAAITSIPFVVTAAFVILYASRGTAREIDSSSGLLDRAIAHDPSSHSDREDRASAHSEHRHTTSLRPRQRLLRGHDRSALAILAIVAVVPLVVSGLWIGVIELGLAYSVAFLSYTVITGEGGMISLCQITFAAIGAVATAQFATVHHWPVLLAVLAGGVVAAPAGVLIGLISLRLGDLYLALITLTFGVLMDNLVFNLNTFSNYSEGVFVNRPAFASGDRAFAYLVLVVFCLLALFVANLRRSTPGLGITAVRWSEAGARTTGISIIQSKVLLTGIATFIAGIGGGFLALSNGDANPTEFVTFGGLVWLAVTVIMGIRSNMAALAAGLGFSVIPALFANYLSSSFSSVPTLLFGLGAVLLARNPTGLAALHGQQLDWLAGRYRSRRLTMSGEEPIRPGEPVSKLHEADATGRAEPTGANEELAR